MERLPYIDEHAITVNANRDDTWSALLRVMCRCPDQARRPELFALEGRHPFAIYRLVFELEAESADRTRLRARTWAAFPGVHGKAYRALVIGTGAHRIVVRGMLKRIAAAALGGAEADYADVFEAPIPQGDSRTAERALRDAVGRTPGAGGSLVLWIHRHVLRLRLGPYSSPDHIIGWPIARSDDEEIVLTSGGPLLRGRLTLRRQDGRTMLITGVHYNRIAARTVWAVLGPLHRAVAPGLVKRIAAHA